MRQGLFYLSKKNNNNNKKRSFLFGERSTVVQVRKRKEKVSVKVKKSKIFFFSRKIHTIEEKLRFYLGKRFWMVHARRSFFSLTEDTYKRRIIKN